MKVAITVFAGMHKKRRRGNVQRGEWKDGWIESRLFVSRDGDSSWGTLFAAVHGPKVVMDASKVKSRCT